MLTLTQKRKVKKVLKKVKKKWSHELKHVITTTKGSFHVKSSKNRQF